MSSGSLEDDQGLIAASAALDDEGPWQKLAGEIGVPLVTFIPNGCETQFEESEGFEIVSQPGILDLELESFEELEEI